jgi:hypothetical protein
VTDMIGAVSQPRVIVTRPMIGLCYMQVCVVADATDEEILQACNDENPAGTRNGWTTVVRHADLDGMADPAGHPVVCSTHADRLHVLVSC